ncbi:hypothetical protein HDR60_00020 [bacterium]|nr:hypothetical protein [bacterium]
MNKKDIKDIISVIILTAIIAGLPLTMLGREIRRKKRYNELPLTTGTVVDKIKLNDGIKNTMIFVDIDDDKDTVERVIFTKENYKNNNLFIDKIQKDSQIKFKDAKKILSIEDIYQIDDLSVNQR